MRSFSLRMKLTAALILAALFGVTSTAIARVVVSGGSVLSVTGTSLTTTYTVGTSTIMQGSEDVDFTISSTFKAGTTITSISYQVVISDDNASWLPVQVLADSTGTTAATQTYTAVANSTVSDHLRTQNHREAKYTAIQVKIAGTAAAGDAASATVKYSYSN